MRTSRRIRALVALSISVGAAVAAAPGAARANSAQPTYQYGMNTYMTYQCQSQAAYLGWASTQLAGFKELGANSVAIAFPIYTNSMTANNVFPLLNCESARYLTPPPTLIAGVIRIAHDDGLQVLLRPLVYVINEPPHQWRGLLQPSDISLWIANYQHTLRPYLEIAQRLHVEHFAISSELDSIATRGAFSHVVAQARYLYHGDVVVTYTWTSPYGKTPWPGTSQGVDTYPELVGAPTDLTPGQLLGEWDYLLNKNPQYALQDATAETIDEVGILAQDGAYQHPLVTTYRPFDQAIQANWYTAACMFMKEHHMQGIYFWGEWTEKASGQLLASPSPKHLIWVQPAAQQAIRRCFTS